MIDLQEIVQYDEQVTFYVTVADAERIMRERDKANRDSKRLEFLLSYIRTDDVGDEDWCPGVVVKAESLEEDLTFAPKRNLLLEAGATGSLMEGVNGVDMRKLLDLAMEAKGART